jgi:hypothetical protein
MLTTIAPLFFALALLTITRHHARVQRRHERDAAALRLALRLAHAQLVAALPPAKAPKAPRRLEGKRRR